MEEAQVSQSIAREESFLARVNSGDKEAIKQYICSKSWDCNTAIRIATCESGLRWNATNETGADMSYGIFQINIKGSLANNRPSKEELLVPTKNIDFAYSMYARQGFNPWSCY